MRPQRSSLLGLAVLASIMACSPDAAGPTSGSPFTSTEAARVGASLAREAGMMMSAMGAGGGGSMPLSIVRVPRGVVADVVGASCPSFNNTVDSDHDGVPDDATATFALPQCRTVSAGDTIEVTGTIEIADPVPSPPPSPAAFGYQATITNLTVRFAALDPDSSFVETRSGAEALVLLPDGLHQMHAMQVAREDTSGATEAAESFQNAFAPAAGQVLVPGQPLPAGALILAGTSDWTHGGASAHFQIATAAPLAYDPSCPANASNQFRSGELHAAMGNPGGSAVVRIVFGNCEAPVVELLAH